MIEPLVITFETHCSRDHAFHVWTSRIDAWWPRDHTASGEPSARVTIEPRMGGRIFERTIDGAEYEWGEITAWNPTEHFGYLWHLRRDRSDGTDVSIRFTEIDPTTTRVDIRHTGWERLGADAQDWRDRNRGGWDGILPHYRAAAERKNT
ncbi:MULTISPECIES: SRPBCC domain-containing protein [unclassified Cryobacterium]|uniref:SRPBCC domain-containing protein n=1 Tax=unclassified Cryobacterium TaxID=2649013 RepID=UPI002AB39C94|nr:MULTISPECIES: SRPBCC domain-containing protein [unclassified Cryobacterium]MDY7541329.1 SRPBCC domain-containing protein [Cryobacterium sp. 5B3]MEA9998129.1 SRPBCC domain-containing protein [Cryobacterium sp. RTS3]MEB0265319.1 SRPBCC domain-containing protein [Cryobacterium sp. 10I5]MEB0273372.1 SRPBCC domain-containing protein [Cryobacterium sp. 5B3]